MTAASITRARWTTSLLVTWLVTSSVSAQWAPHPAGNVPRTEKGDVDLAAPAPRMPDGTPDLSGVWQRASDSEDASESDDSGNDGDPPLATFFDLGANLDDGLPMRDWARELRDQRVADGMKDNPDAHCLPLGFMQFHLHPQPRKIVQTPELIVILYEANYGVRQIFTDGRSLPGDDALPWWYGYSVGRWEGDTLIVESTGFRDGGWLDVQGSPLTDEAKIVERFRRLDTGHMQIDVTIDDPKAYTEPFTVRVTHELMPDDELIEFICLENEQSTLHFDE
jgi:hypothetical protein